MQLTRTPADTHQNKIPDVVQDRSIVNDGARRQEGGMEPQALAEPRVHIIYSFWASRTSCRGRRRGVLTAWLWIQQQGTQQLRPVLEQSRSCTGENLWLPTGGEERVAADRDSERKRWREKKKGERENMESSATERDVYGETNNSDVSQYMVLTCSGRNSNDYP